MFFFKDPGPPKFSLFPLPFPSFLGRVYTSLPSNFTIVPIVTPRHLTVALALGFEHNVDGKQKRSDLLISYG